jgi:MFS family permease
MTAKQAMQNIMQNSRLRLLLLYRSLANHVAFLPLIILPTLSERGMPNWFSGIVTALAAMGMMLSTRYAYLLGERYGYRKAWVIGTVMQALLLIAAGLLVDWWMPLVGIFLLFNISEGLWQPSWNHVLIEETTGLAIATTRSVIFSAFALYTTIGKQILALFPLSYALMGMGVFIIAINLLLGRRMIAQQKSV